MVVKRVAQDGRGFHHRAVGIRAAVEAPGKTPAPFLFSFGRQGKSDDKNHGAGQNVSYDGSNDGHSGYTTDVADDVGQLNVHLSQCFLHSQNGRGNFSHVFGSQSPIGAHRQNLGWRTERIAQ